MIIKNPFMDNFFLHFACVVIGLFTGGVALIPYIGVLWYLKKKREDRTLEIVNSELDEEPKIQFKAHMEDIGYGQLGVTNNYLFFVPTRKNEESVVVNLKYLTYFDAQTVATQETTKEKDFDGSETSSPGKAPIFVVKGVSKDNLEFTYTWITGAGRNKNNKKLFEVMKSLDSSPQNVHVSRKQL